MNAPPSPISETSTISPLPPISPASPSSARTPVPDSILRRTSVASSGSAIQRPSSTPASPSRKPRARELLRQHYGISRTPTGGIDANSQSGVNSSRRGSAAGGPVLPPEERSNDPLDLGTPFRKNDSQLC